MKSAANHMPDLIGNLTGYAAAPVMPRASVAIDNLRAVVIVMVLAFHAMLAYVAFLPAHPFAFDAPPYLWRAFPIVDGHRWFGFDLFCAWLDVFLMSFFYLLSGLFVWSSLSRKGLAAFLQDRLLRLALPFAAVVMLLMPLALYPTFVQSTGDATIAEYWRAWLGLPFWPSGPVWFLWLLLLWDALAAGVYLLVRRRGDRVLRLSFYARQRPTVFLGGLLLASALAYVPLALIFAPASWYQAGPFAFQLSRPLHYVLYFFAGAVIGACGIERGLFAPDGPLVRHWARWMVGAVVWFFAWGGLTALAAPDPWADAFAAPLALRAAAALSYVLACLSSCFFVFAAAIRFGAVRAQLLDSLNANAFGIYLVHYIFIVWLQFALLDLALPAIIKAATVFSATLTLSWTATAVLRRVPAIANIIGADRRRTAGGMTDLNLCRPGPVHRVPAAPFRRSGRGSALGQRQRYRDGKLSMNRRLDFPYSSLRDST
jgi:Acyltransferase family